MKECLGISVPQGGSGDRKRKAAMASPGHGTAPPAGSAASRAGGPLAGPLLPLVAIAYGGAVCPTFFRGSVDC